MTQTKQPILRLGGVPEHFNAPWHLAKKAGQFHDAPYDITWQDFHGGTGALTRAMDEGEIDAALVLTEGILSYLAKGGQARLAGTYVSSPLLWGIHVHQDSKIDEEADLIDATYGISRFGSGSHLMAVVSTASRHWPIDNMKFEVVRSMEGARGAMAENKDIAFMWEKFTTKPLVDAGEWRRVETFAAPWPAFVLALSDRAADQFEQWIPDLFQRVQPFCPSDDPHNPPFTQYISENYGQQPKDVQEWFVQTQWRCHKKLSQTALTRALSALNALNITDVPEDDMIQKLHSWALPSVEWIEPV